MKALISTIVLFAMVCGFNDANAGQSNTKEVTIAVSEVLVPEVVPKGTDVKIVMSGLMPNGCYRWSKAEVASAGNNVTNIQARALVTGNTMCIMVLIPFIKEINLGQMSVGTHTLRFISGDETYFERVVVVQ